MSRLPIVSATVAAVAVLGAAAWLMWVPRAPTAVPEAVPAYVGRTVCAACHGDEATAWSASHHDLAMQDATEATVLGDFAEATLEHEGVQSRFFRRDGRFMVRTDGPDGELADFEVQYTFGVAPLQQYLIELPGGRLQALSIAWDTRPAADGGQRWFHLYPDQHIGHDDPLHWTGLQQNWNYMCAECHSTHVQRNYDAASGSYATTWSEIDVSCEACHGPGSMHVNQAREGRGPADAGLLVAFDERRGVSWPIDPASGRPVRSRTRNTSTELDACARCHSRRGQIWEPYVHGRPIGDTHRVALLDASLYFPDGQMRDEVYEWGSFVQSRMHEAGVTCSDCHDPHSLGLRAPGMDVCAQCHAVERYSTPAHHHHPQASSGADCLACHMPERTYMGVDRRRDHSLRVPRPDLTVTLGTPNPCTGCHTGETPAWAADLVAAWFGPEPSGLQQWTTVLHDADIGAAGARERLFALAMDHSVPAIARASALERLDRLAREQHLTWVQELLRDQDPLVRRAAVAVHDLVSADARMALFAVLSDPVRDVRLEAVPLLAAVPSPQLTPEQWRARDAVNEEYVNAQMVNADRPEAHFNLGALWALLGNAGDARQAYETALSLDPTFSPAAVNLANLAQAAGDETRADAVLRKALERNPSEAALHHALGLSLVRSGRHGEALEALESAARLGPESARFGYVYAVALDGAGRHAEALSTLERVLERHPNDRDTLAALVAYERNAGKDAEAALHAERLAELEPDM